MSVIVACTKKKCRKLYSTLSKNITRLSKTCNKSVRNYVGLKRGVKFISLSWSSIRNVFYGLS